MIAVHIDNGFMRKNESDNVERSLRKVGLELDVLRSAHRFYSSHTSYPMVIDGIPVRHITDPLVNVYSPEEKRHIIGDTFVRVSVDFYSLYIYLAKWVAKRCYSQFVCLIHNSMFRRSLTNILGI